MRRKPPSSHHHHRATRGVTIALVSSRERKWRQPGLAPAWSNSDGTSGSDAPRVRKLSQDAHCEVALVLSILRVEVDRDVAASTEGGSLSGYADRCDQGDLPRPFREQNQGKGD